MSKKAIALFSTIILVFTFSIVAVTIYETKSINSFNIINQYKYIQARNHLTFLEQYINSLKELKDISKIEIKDKSFNIEAIINKKSSNTFQAQLSVKAINFNVRVYKKLEIIK